MNLLYSIFNLIKPEEKTTKLSCAYHRFENERIKNDNSNFRERNTPPSVYFEVPGAGDICISESCHHLTGGVIGFSFGVEWGKYGYTGGVLGRDEAKRMAEFILQKCSETTETMQDELERREIELKIKL